MNGKASGNPIISNANNNTEIVKIVERAVFQINPKDQIGFIKALDYLIADEKVRLNLGKKARKIAEKNFSKELILENFNKFIKKLTH